MWRLTLTGQAMARVFAGEPFDALLGMLVLIAGLILLRAVLQFARDEIANATAALMKARVRGRLYEHVCGSAPAISTSAAPAMPSWPWSTASSSSTSSLASTCPQLVVAALTPVIIFVFMAFLDLPTAVIFLVFALLTLVAPAAFHRLNSSASLGFRRAQVAMGADFLDSIQGLATLKSFGQSGARGR